MSCYMLRLSVGVTPFECDLWPWHLFAITQSACLFLIVEHVLLATTSLCNCCSCKIIFTYLAVSLGEVIARTAAAQVETVSSAAQTSFKLPPETKQYELPTQLTSPKKASKYHLWFYFYTIAGHITVPNRISYSKLCTIIGRDVGTSPVPLLRRRRRPRTTAFTQVSSVKQRLNSLQLKVTALTTSREQAKERIEELTAECGQLQSQLSLANNKISGQRATIQVCDTSCDNLPIWQLSKATPLRA